MGRIKDMSNHQLVNVTEEIVSGLVRYSLRRPEYQIFCHCEECELNIIAEALNELPPHYVTTKSKRDQVFQELKTDANMEKMNKSIIHAIYKVGKKVNHED